MMSSILIFLGIVFVLIASLGLVRMPNFLSRMQATSKAATLGIGLILMGGIIQNPSLESILKSILILFFLLLTRLPLRLTL